MNNPDAILVAERLPAEQKFDAAINDDWVATMASPGEFAVVLLHFSNPYAKSFFVRSMKSADLQSMPFWILYTGGGLNDTWWYDRDVEETWRKSCEAVDLATLLEGLPLLARALAEGGADCSQIRTAFRGAKERRALAQNVLAVLILVQGAQLLGADERNVPEDWFKGCLPNSERPTPDENVLGFLTRSLPGTSRQERGRIAEDATFPDELLQAMREEMPASEQWSKIERAGRRLLDVLCK